MLMPFGPAEKAAVLLHIRGSQPVPETKIRWAVEQGYATLSIDRNIPSLTRAGDEALDSGRRID